MRKSREILLPLSKAQRNLLPFTVLYPGDAVLDLYCEDAALLQYLSRRTSGQIALSGLSFTPEKAALVQEILPEAEILQAEQDDLPWLLESVDIALCAPSAPFWRSWPFGIAEAYRLLRPGGQLMLSLPAWVRIRAPGQSGAKGTRTLNREALLLCLEQAGFQRSELLKTKWGRRVLIGWKPASHDHGTLDHPAGKG